MRLYFSFMLASLAAGRLRDRACSDEELMQRFIENDGEAFAELFRRYESTILAYMLRRLRRRERAEELAQDVFEKMVRNRARFGEGRAFRPWIFGIARNTCIDEFRRQSHRKETSLDVPLGEDGGNDWKALIADMNAEAGSVVVDKRAFAEALELAIEELPEAQRDTFVLRFAHGLKFREIAKLHEVSDNTVKSRLRYALASLALALERFKGIAFDHEQARIVRVGDQRSRV